jgi:RNA polymerase sigma factor (sigma-70 family)
MQTKSDAQLLREYADHGTEAAFTEIVARHTNLVFSAALRQVNSPDSAAEVAQSVFVSLARGARSLSRRLAEDASLAGWLCRSARNVSLNIRRDDFRRHSRERLAMEDLNPTSETAPDWERLRSVLDAAMSELDESDYDALVMRFFRNQDLRSVGRALGVSDDTAQKRVARALDKLRDLLTRRGITTTAAALSIVLSTNAVQAAPVGLAAAISTAAALARTAVHTSTAIAVTKNIAMTTLQKAFISTALAAAVGTGIYESQRASHLQEQTRALALQQDSLAKQLQDERDAASNELAAAQLKSSQAHGDLSEILRLRAQVAKLRDDNKRLAELKNAAASTDNDPAAAEMNSMLARVKKLKDRLEQMPDRKIPEFQYLTEKDWLDAAESPRQLESEADFQKALGALRSAAKGEVANVIQGALNSFAQANNGQGQVPTDLSQLKPYFASPVDDSVLQSYEITQPGTVSSAKAGSLIDEDGNYYSYQVNIGLNSISSSHDGEDGLHDAIQAFLAANNGQSLTDPAQLLAYVQSPAEQAVLQKILNRNAVSK